MINESTTIHRAVEDDVPYFLVSRELAQDSRLGFETRGMLVYLLSKPANWTVNVKDLQREGGIGRDKAYRLIAECIELGYMRRVESRIGGTFAGNDIHVFSTPQLDIPQHEPSPYPEKPDTVKPDTENQDTYSKEYKSSKEKREPQQNTPRQETPSKADSSSGGGGLTLADAYRVYESNVGVLNSITSDAIADDVELYGAQWFVDAVSVAVKAGKHNLRYIEGILRRWKADGREDKPEPAPVAEGIVAGVVWD